MQFIKKLQAKRFLKNINKNDKIAIIHHDDSDGMCSAILFQNHCQNKGAKTKNFFYTMGETKFKKLNLKPFNKIILTDISTKDTYKQIKDLGKKKIFYTDHHPTYPLPNSITTYLTAKQGYIPSSRTAYELTKGKKFLSLLGVIADAGNFHKENNSFLKSALKYYNLTLEQFQTKYSHVLSDTLIYFEKSPQKGYNILAKLSSLQDITKLKKYAKVVEKEIQKTVKLAKKNSEKINGINIYQIKPKYKIKGIVAAILSRENTEEPHVFISQKTSNPKFLGISARHNSDSANLPKLLETTTKNLKDSNTGGHPRASGGQIRTKDLKKFKQNIKNYAKK
ncbi:DHH family phosphoesterase [Methanococcoides sp. SA1]|nr:DHH family phosphoesterase [Methanococcoides sp. SA1]